MYKITGCEYQIDLMKKAVDIAAWLEKGELCAVLDAFKTYPEVLKTRLIMLREHYVKRQEESVFDDLLANIIVVDDEFGVVLSDSGVGLVSQACDLVSRLMICQFDNVADYVSIDNDKNFVMLWEFRDCLNELKLMFGLHVNASYGIYSEQVDDDARCLWDMHQVIRNRLAYDANPGITPENRWRNGKMTVDFDEPMHSDKRFPLVRIEKVE